MSHTVTLLAQGFLVQRSPEIASDTEDGFRVVVDGLTRGFGYTRALVESPGSKRSHLVVAFAFDDEDDVALSAGLPAIAARFPSYVVVKAAGVHIRDGVFHMKLVSEASPSYAVAGAAAAMCSTSDPATPLAAIEMRDVTHAARVRDIEGAYAVDVEPWTKRDSMHTDGVKTEPPSKKAEALVVALESVAKELASSFTDPHARSLYLVAMRELARVYGEVGLVEKSKTTFGFYRANCDLFGEPSDHDRAAFKDLMRDALSAG